MSGMRFIITALLVTAAFAFSGSCGADGLGKNKDLNSTDSHYSAEVSAAGIGADQNDDVLRAAGFIRQGNLDEAQKILATVLRNFAKLMPEGRGNTYVCFDNDNDYEQFIEQLQPGKRKQVVRVHAGYAQALQLTAFIASAHHEWDTALKYLDRRMAVAPDDMQPLLEKGYILNAQGKPQQALETYEKAYALGKAHHAVNFELAAALRGKGSALIDLGRLDEAEDSFNKSLQIDPGNPVAMNELEYIKKVRAQGR